MVVRLLFGEACVSYVIIVAAVVLMHIQSYTLIMEYSLKTYHERKFRDLDLVVLRRPLKILRILHSWMKIP